MLGGATAMGIPSVGRWRLSLVLKAVFVVVIVAAGLHQLANLENLHSVYKSVSESLGWSSTVRTRIAVTMLSPSRRIEEDPAPVNMTADNDLFFVAGVVMDQRRTWQDGSRPPYFVQIALFWQTTDPSVRPLLPR